jgi:hypothetical protein
MVFEAFSLFVPMTVEQTLLNLMQFIKRSLSVFVEYFHASLFLYSSGQIYCIFYFYRCTVHFEDSLIITYQQMHQLNHLLFKIGFNH